MTLAKQICVCISGLTLTLNCVATTAAEVVPVVSAKSHLTTLSNNQLVDIFLGKLSRLPDGEPIVPIDQAEGTPGREEFYLNVAGKTAAQVKAHWSKIIFTGRGKPPAQVSSDAEVKKRLSENPNAIGYVERGAVDDSLRVLTVK